MMFTGERAIRVSVSRSLVEFYKPSRPQHSSLLLFVVSVVVAFFVLHVFLCYKIEYRNVLCGRQLTSSGVDILKQKSCHNIPKKVPK